MLGAVRLQLECPVFGPHDDIAKVFSSVPTYHAVYVITASGNPCKVGFSNDPKMRLDGLQASSPETLRLAFAIWFETNSIAFQVEQATHRRLALKKRHGEWFDVEPGEAIDAVAHCIADKKVPYAAHADMLEFKATLWSRYRAEHEARDKKMTNWVKAKPDKVWRDPDFVYYRRDGETVIEGV